MNPRAYAFDPDGGIDAIVLDYVDGCPVLADAPPEPTAFDLHRLVDPSIPGSAEPAEPNPDDDEPSAADRCWWAESTRNACLAGVPLDTFRVMCAAAGLGAVGFCDGFEPHAEDWPTLDDVPLPTWDDGLLLAEV